MQLAARWIQAKSPCYTRLDRIQKLDSELKALKEEMKEKMKDSYRAVLRKRAASDSAVELS